MTRSRIGTLAAIVHSLYAGATAALSIYLFWRSHVPLSGAQNEGLHAHSIFLGGCAIGMVAVVYAICAVGLWRDSGWASWLSMSVNAVGLLIFTSEFLGDYAPDSYDWLAIVLLCVPLLLSLWNTMQRRHASPGGPTGHVETTRSAPSV